MWTEVLPLSAEPAQLIVASTFPAGDPRGGDSCVPGLSPGCDSAVRSSCKNGVWAVPCSELRPGAAAHEGQRSPHLSQLRNQGPGLEPEAPRQGIPSPVQLRVQPFCEVQLDPPRFLQLSLCLGSLWPFAEMVSPRTRVMLAFCWDIRIPSSPSEGAAKREKEGREPSNGSISGIT